MKRGFLSTGVLFLVLVGLLGALALGYGLWSKTLTIEGTVNTGNFNADWDAASTNDPTAAPGEVSLDPCTPALNPTGCTAPPKDVGSCVVTGLGTQDLEILIDNAYPSYECTIKASITNTGTIPFNVVGVSLEPDSVPGELLGDCVTPTTSQVDPGQEWTASCTVHVKQEATERTTYKVNAIVCVGQWNESPTLEECIAAAGQSEPGP
jgi:hypothetical protein